MRKSTMRILLFLSVTLSEKRILLFLSVTLSENTSKSLSIVYWKAVKVWVGWLKENNSKYLTGLCQHFVTVKTKLSRRSFINDNDNDNNFFVMNYISKMTAVNWTQQVGILTLHLNFGIVFWNSWQRGYEASAYRPQHLFTLFTLGCKTANNDKLQINYSIQIFYWHTKEVFTGLWVIAT